MFDDKTRCVVLVGVQWGDEGKGKITDVLAEQATLVARYQGGANAGHTVLVDEDEISRNPMAKMKPPTVPEEPPPVLSEDQMRTVLLEEEEGILQLPLLLEGMEDVKDHVTWRIALTPTGESPYRRVRVWVDEESFLVRRFEILEENETVRTVILDELRPNESIADSVFEFVPPEGTDVFEG